MRNCIASLIVLSLLLGGCAGGSTRGMKTASTADVIHVEKNIVYQVERGLFGRIVEIEIRSGEYRAKLADEGGTYYEGGPACLSLKQINGGREDLIGKKLSALDCGFYLPNDLQQAVAVYFVIGTGASIMAHNTLDEIELASRGILPDAAQSATAAASQSAAVQLAADNHTAATPKQYRGGAAAGVTMAILGSIENGRVVKDQSQPPPNLLPPLLGLAGRR